MTNCENKMDKLLENEHPLVTPNFIGTDEEKIQVINYWSQMITFLRSLNGLVISHENKLAIISQLIKEMDIINLEINNVTAHQVTSPDGSTEMSTMPANGEVAVEDPVTVSATAPVVNLAEPEVKKSNPYEAFNRPAVSTSEAMQRLAGTYYSNKSKKK